MQLDSTFARRVFLFAGLYGLAVLAPQSLVELAGEAPPLERPDLHYGFTGVALVWQVAFLLIARDVERYRPFMLVAVLEKLAFGLAAVALFAAARVPALVMVFGGIDLALGALFVLAHRATRPAADAG